MALSMKIFSVFFLMVFLLAAPAGAQSDQASLPAMPAPIQELVNQGAQARFLGKEYGLDAWITVKSGQEQYFYVLPDKKAFLMGVLFDDKGKMVTMRQVQRLQSQGDSLLDSLTDGFEEPEKKTSKEFGSPSERMFSDIENSNWAPLGQLGAPVMYAFIDPQCPHCHEFISRLRKDYLDKGLTQLRMIPVGFKDDTKAQAAYLLAAPNPMERWYRHMDGDAAALPAKSDISDQGVQRNLAIMQQWKLDATPLIVYRSKDGKVKIVRGQPKDIPSLISDLGARS